MGLMQFLKNRKVDICFMLMIVGGFTLFMSLMALMAEQGSGSVWEDVSSSIGNWKYWLFVLGGGTLSVGAYYLADFVKKRRELLKLLEITSKSKFIKNQDRIEELAWRLGRNYEAKVVERKKQLRVK